MLITLVRERSTSALCFETWHNKRPCFPATRHCAVATSFSPADREACDPVLVCPSATATNEIRSIRTQQSLAVLAKNNFMAWASWVDAVSVWDEAWVSDADE